MPWGCAAAGPSYTRAAAPAAARLRASQLGQPQRSHGASQLQREPSTMPSSLPACTQLTPRPAPPCPAPPRSAPPGVGPRRRAGGVAPLRGLPGGRLGQRDRGWAGRASSPAPLAARLALPPCGPSRCPYSLGAARLPSPTAQCRRSLPYSFLMGCIHCTTCLARSNLLVHPSVACCRGAEAALPAWPLARSAVLEYAFACIWPAKGFTQASQAYE